MLTFNPGVEEMQAGYKAQQAALEKLQAMELESDSESIASQLSDAAANRKNRMAKRAAIAGDRRMVLATAICKKSKFGNTT